MLERRPIPWYADLEAGVDKTSANHRMLERRPCRWYADLEAGADGTSAYQEPLDRWPLAGIRSGQDGRGLQDAGTPANSVVRGPRSRSGRDVRVPRAPGPVASCRHPEWTRRPRTTGCWNAGQFRGTRTSGPQPAGQRSIAMGRRPERAVRPRSKGPESAGGAGWGLLAECDAPIAAAIPDYAGHPGSGTDVGVHDCAGEGAYARPLRWQRPIVATCNAQRTPRPLCAAPNAGP
jgi:hypothetical protein